MTTARGRAPRIPWRLRSPHVQSYLATSRLRLPWIREPRTESREVLLDGGGGVRLLALHDPADSPRGLAVLLHGWEGSAGSTYLRSLRAVLVHAGWEVFRLNFRDHGGTQALNRELFHSCRIAEVVAAFAAVAVLSRARPLVAVGFSLGGNFALRVALRAPAAGVPLAGAVAVSPVLDPRHTLTALERGSPLYHAHFVQKWRHSILAKERAFPDAYDFREWLALGDLRSQTRYLVERFTEYPSLDAYFDGYAIAGDRLAGLRVPAVLLHSDDDPINPAEDVRALSASDSLVTEILPLGGHCGFLEGLASPTWLDLRILDEISHMNI